MLRADDMDSLYALRVPSERRCRCMAELGSCMACSAGVQSEAASGCALDSSVQDVSCKYELVE